MRIIIIMIFLTLGLLHAQSIHQLIHHAIKKHPSLTTIKHRLLQMDDKIAMSQNLKNPDLSLTLNDIHFNDPLSRTLEPMQYQAINIKQSIPWFGKLAAQKDYAYSQKKVILHSYEAAKVALSLNIRTTAYTMKELALRLGILDKYKAVVRQNIDLYTSYASTQEQSHTESMSASLLLSKIKIRYQNYLSILQIQKAKLKYLVQKKVTAISDTLKIRKPKKLAYYLKRATHNPNYQSVESKITLADAHIKLKHIETNPDPYVKVGYFNRQGFDDFASISVGISLPLYGTEKQTLEIARKDLLVSSSETLDFKSSLYAQIEEHHAKLMEAYNVYNIITNESLPQLKHMFELSQANIQNGADLFDYTKLLEQKLMLEEERISIQANYKRTEATLKSLIGER
jgi:outer membrane protein TolC